jgi:hypothetical protein
MGGRERDSLGREERVRVLAGTECVEIESAAVLLHLASRNCNQLNRSTQSFVGNVEARSG